MSGLHFLTSEDFNIGNGTKGPILILENMRGLALVLFYSTQCSHCQNFIPIFKRLPGSISGCQFGMINVSQNRQVVAMSKETIAPIKYVPYIVLFVQGKPFMRYDGPHDEAELKRFVFEVASKLQSREKFTNNQKVKDDGKTIPAYTVGVPLCGDDDDSYRCFIDAYDDRK
jgi:thioredoxin-like negative regulator of GroEL